MDGNGGLETPAVQIMQTRTNAIAWNPMEAFNFTTASEDCNLYSYDMRKLDSSTNVHKVCSHSLPLQLHHAEPKMRMCRGTTLENGYSEFKGKASGFGG
jgi:hypothetical protein